MLTAKKENSSVETESPAQRLQTTRSFDRMVNSIEGLRERVQGLTLEQVLEVDQRLHRMSRELSELERTLRALAEIKRQITRLQKAVQQVEAESLEQSKVATLVEPIAVQSIAQVGTLLKFRRLIKFLKEAKEASGVSASADVEARFSVQPRPFEIIQERRNEQKFATDLPAIQHELLEDSDNKDVAVVMNEAVEQTEVVFHPASLEADFEADESFSNERTGVAFFDENTALNRTGEIIAEFADTRDEPPTSHVRALIETDARMDETIFEEFRGTGKVEANLAAPETETVDATLQSRAPNSDEADFDQRLLDDLIKDYGEFTILPTSTAKHEVKKETKLEAGTTLSRVSAPATVNPPTQPDLPSQRKDGELDRKLKKLIKDYGEYDLYSRQTPLKLKTGVVAAFLVLTLIFSGFYFFSSPKSAVPASASSASQSQSFSNTASEETPRNGGSNSGETLSPPSVSNVDVPKSVEAGASHNIGNRATAKKTK
jgi:hypothetical protein